MQSTSGVPAPRVAGKILVVLAGIAFVVLQTGRTYEPVSMFLGSSVTFGRPPAGQLCSMSDSPVRLQVWSDYVCPFCYLEMPVLDRLQREYGDRLAVEWKAFELRPEPIPTLDPDGSYLHDVWSRSVYPMARERGVMLRLPPVQPRSRPAHEAGAFAGQQGAFDRMHRGLFRAFFEEGRDIGDVDVLTEIAGEEGLDGEALRRALDKGRYTGQVLGDRALADRLGIRGVPAIVALAPGETLASEGVEGVSGAHPDATIRRMIERASDRAK